MSSFYIAGIGGGRIPGRATQPLGSAGPNPIPARPGRRYVDERDPLLWTRRGTSPVLTRYPSSGGSDTRLGHNRNFLTSAIRKAAEAAYSVCQSVGRAFKHARDGLVGFIRGIPSPWSSRPSQPATLDQIGAQSLTSGVDDCPELSDCTTLSTTDSKPSTRRSIGNGGQSHYFCPCRRGMTGLVPMQ